MMVHRHACGECGTQVDFLTRDGDLYCECGAELEFSGTVGVVYSSANDIRPQVVELVEEWREHQEDCNLPRSGLTNEGHIFKECADELEELIEP